MRLKIAVRNVLRNKRRTALNVCMVAGGVGALIVFNGFSTNVVNGLRDVTIRTQTGHVQVASTKFWDKTARSPKEALLPGYAKLRRQILKHPEVKTASGRLSFFGLISQGEQSTSAQGMSFDPSAEGNINEAFEFKSGRGFKRANAYEVAIGEGLAARLGTKVGDRVTVLVNTFDGVVNALDLEVVGLFTTAVASIDDRTFLIPLRVAQGLLDTRSVEQIVIGLKPTGDAVSVASDLRSSLGAGLGIKTWYEVADLYRQVEEFNRVQNLVLEFIILSLILLGVLNTIGMSVFERTGEIGTVAALGEGGSTILGQFVLEGLILGVMGSAAGVFFGMVATLGINWLEMSMVMPGATKPLTVELSLYLWPFLNGAFLSVLAATLASVFPAFRASRMNIAAALRHNI